jgi:hypothetical protein
MAVHVAAGSGRGETVARWTARVSFGVNIAAARSR